MRIISLLIPVFFLVGCATSSAIYTEDGLPGYAVDCSGDGLGWTSCYEEASKVCGEKGYLIIQKDTDGDMTTWQTRTLVIQCKE